MKVYILTINILLFSLAYCQQVDHCENVGSFKNEIKEKDQTIHDLQAFIAYILSDQEIQINHQFFDDLNNQQQNLVGKEQQIQGLTQKLEYIHDQLQWLANTIL
jgi:dsRNA-specific ribonuclease